MTLRELIEAADRHPWILIVAFVLPSLLSWVIGLCHGEGQGRVSPWKYLYAALVYAACVPGLFAGVLTAYSLFFSRENLLDVSLFASFVPIVSMVITLVLIRRRVSFDDVPGFDRLSGLMVMIGCSFALALAIDKTHIWIWFSASIDRLFLLALGIFALIKWGSYMLFRRGTDPKKPLPPMPLE